MSLEAILYFQSAPLLFVSLTRLFSCGNGCRDDANVIFRRFTGSLFASIISAVFAQLWRPKNMDPFEYLGLRLQGLSAAFMLPLLLTTSVFAFVNLLIQIFITLADSFIRVSYRFEKRFAGDMHCR
ncbi:CAAX prenyl protease 2 [Trichinella spiralis]|uniref:CAAX prenyl protease 2 n=1 Tax=Trichinella spiralis TaxID=6334 RepID=UPI0001EFB6C8|nr:CAAX prenyl protease 2 [Trichinella spiralis]